MYTLLKQVFRGLGESSICFVTRELREICDGRGLTAESGDTERTEGQSSLVCQLSVGMAGDFGSVSWRLRT